MIGFIFLQAAMAIGLFISVAIPIVFVTCFIFSWIYFLIKIQREKIIWMNELDYVMKSIKVAIVISAAFMLLLFILLFIWNPTFM